MARQAKGRKVCIMPKNVQFQTKKLPDTDFFKSDLNREKPLVPGPIVMSVEEYEAIRLIDYMGFTQEECAKHMQVARTTVQRIYNDARKKLSIFLVDGLELSISGGSYELCSKGGNCRCQTIPCKEGLCEKGQKTLCF